MSQLSRKSQENSIKFSLVILIGISIGFLLGLTIFGIRALHKDEVSVRTIFTEQISEETLEPLTIKESATHKYFLIWVAFDCPSCRRLVPDFINSIEHAHPKIGIKMIFTPLSTEQRNHDIESALELSQEFGFNRKMVEFLFSGDFSKIDIAEFLVKNGVSQSSLLHVEKSTSLKFDRRMKKFVDLKLQGVPSFMFIENAEQALIFENYSSAKSFVEGL